VAVRNLKFLQAAIKHLNPDYLVKESFAPPWD
jgi:hypothetical protein